MLSYPDEGARKAAATRLLARATTVEACLGVVVSWEAAAQAFEAAFGEALNLTFEKDELSSVELSRTNELMAAKYDNAVWLQKR